MTIGALAQERLPSTSSKRKLERSWPGVEGTPHGSELSIEHGNDGDDDDRSAPPDVDRRTIRELTSYAGSSGSIENPISDDVERVSESRRDWLAAQRENRCVFVSGDSMSPVVADGSFRRCPPRKRKKSPALTTSWSLPGSRQQSAGRPLVSAMRPICFAACPEPGHCSTTGACRPG